MAPNKLPPHRRCCFVLALAGALLPANRVRSQTPSANSPELWRAPVLGRELLSAWMKNEPAPDPIPVGRAARVRMLGMMPGFLADPVGLDNSDDPAAINDPAARALAGTGNDGPNWLQVVIGDDNPYFDLRQPGDPGGVGFFKVYSQLQLVDVGSTSVCVDLQAVTPAGQQSGGLADGPTVVMPGVALFHELGAGTALQGFVGQPIRTSMRSGDPVNHPIRYGMGFQCPVFCGGGNHDQGLYFFMQALGRYYYEGERPNGRAANWDLVPGVHFRLNDKCWMSLGASRNSLLTCSWQF